MDTYDRIFQEIKIILCGAQCQTGQLKSSVKLCATKELTQPVPIHRESYTEEPQRNSEKEKKTLSLYYE